MPICLTTSPLKGAGQVRHVRNASVDIASTRSMADGSADLTFPATLPSTGETEESSGPAERNHFVPVDTPALLRVMPRALNDSLILTTAINVGNSCWQS